MLPTVSQEIGFDFNEVPASRNPSFVYLGVPLNRHQLGATQHTACLLKCQNWTDRSLVNIKSLSMLIPEGVRQVSTPN